MDRAEKFIDEATRTPNTLGAPSVLDEGTLKDRLLDFLPRSPVDRRGPLFGVPPAPPPAAPMRGMLMPVDPYYYSRLRETFPRHDPMQSVVGPLEHKEAMQEIVGGNPLMAVPYAGGIPVYTALKAAGMFPQARSPASWDEIFAGYEGLLGGLRNRWTPNS
jgi:hypothetical protein